MAEFFDLHAIADLAEAKMTDELTLSAASKAYAGYMHEIRNRLDAINTMGVAQSNGRSILPSWQLDVESCFLNLRKVIELTFYASASAHSSLGVEIQRRIVAREWNARKVMREIEKVNPSFYPVPIEKALSEDGILRTVPRMSGFLAKEECLHLYDEVCGAALHASRDRAWYAREEYRLEAVNRWHNRIHHLLSHHWIQLREDIAFAVILHLKGSDGIQVAPMQRC